MTGKSMRLVRSKTSFEDMTSMDDVAQLMQQERRQQPMKPPSNLITTERQTLKVPHPAKDLLIIGTQGHMGRFLDKCNNCKKKIGDKDEIYMYSSLRAFCSSECRIEKMLEERLRGIER